MTKILDTFGIDKKFGSWENWYEKLYVRMGEKNWYRLTKNSKSETTNQKVGLQFPRSQMRTRTDQ